MLRMDHHYNRPPDTTTDHPIVIMLLPIGTAIYTRTNYNSKNSNSNNTNNRTTTTSTNTSNTHQHRTLITATLRPTAE